MRMQTRCLHGCLGLALGLSLGFPARALPEAHLLRVDARHGLSRGEPVLTTVIDLGESRRIGDLIAPCDGRPRRERYECMAAALEAPHALFTPAAAFPTAAQLVALVDGTGVPARQVSAGRWGERLGAPGIGTAWLVLIDADDRMGSSFDDARALARELVTAMGPRDVVQVMAFSGPSVVATSGWLPAARRDAALAFVDGLMLERSEGRNRPLFSLVKAAATDEFRRLGDPSRAGVDPPLHQALVLLSNGFGGNDPASTGPGALQLSSYLGEGRFPAEDPLLEKRPVSVVSVFFPPALPDESEANSLEFMRHLTNVALGGFFTVVPPGRGGRAAAIARAVRARFDALHVVEWTAPCLAPSLEQTFFLSFAVGVRIAGDGPQILGDNSFRNVTIGRGTTSWPLAVDVERTRRALGPHGTIELGRDFKVTGDFCWGTDEQRVRAYFLRDGQATLTGADTESFASKRALQSLVAGAAAGSVRRAAADSVTVVSPCARDIVREVNGEATVRLVLLDTRTQSLAGTTSAGVIELPVRAPSSAPRPPPRPAVAAVAVAGPRAAPAPPSRERRSPWRRRRPRHRSPPAPPSPAPPSPAPPSLAPPCPAG